MSNWPLLFVSCSFTFCLCLWCGPWWQQTALLSILNFCAELQHLSLGSCVMVSAWIFSVPNALLSFHYRGEVYLVHPPHTCPHTLCPTFKPFPSSHWRLCLWITPLGGGSVVSGSLPVWILYKSVGQVSHPDVGGLVRFHKTQINPAINSYKFDRWKVCCFCELLYFFIRHNEKADALY